jgi:hypothetical protein
VRVGGQAVTEPSNGSAAPAILGRLFHRT